MDAAFSAVLKPVMPSDLHDRSNPRSGAADCAAFRRAILLHRQGRLREAENYYRAALQIDQNHFDSLHNIGVIQLQRGKPREAVKQILVALKINPNSAEARNNLGSALAQLNLHQQAIVQYLKALSIRGDYAEAYFNLGVLFQALCRYETAIAHYERALSIQPNYAQACYNLGVSLQSLNRLEDAIRHYSRALALNPEYAEAHNNLGNALMQLNRPERAVLHYRKALAIRPHLAQAHNNVGTALHALKHQEEAIGCYERALAIKPDYADAHANMGASLEVLGRIDEASRAYERAIELAPKRADFYRHLFASRRATVADPRFLALRALSQDMPSLPPEQQIELYFALGKVFADIGQHESSFRQFLEGNTLKCRQTAYDEPATLAIFDRIRAKFTAELIGSQQGQGDPSPVPVFILGMPRSGSTLIEQILASHPLVFGGGELNNFMRAIKETAGPREARLPFAEMMSSFAGSRLSLLGAQYTAGIRALAPHAARVTDKMLANFQLAGLIHLALPNARIIHSVRNPVDTCVSCFSTLFATNQPFAYELGELGRYYRAYWRLMEHWRSVLPEGVMLEVRYEELVADLEGQARRLLSHCGLTWNDACLAFQNTQRSVDTASAVQVRQPIYQSSVGRWRRYEPLLGPLLAALGPDCGARPSGSDVV